MKARHEYTSRVWKPGDEVIGVREPHSYAGTFVRAYYTLNNEYRNYAYVILCEDGKERSFMSLQRR